MSKALWLLPLLLLGACDDSSFTNAQKRQDQLDHQIQQNGFAVVGKTPDGKPLLMSEVNVGFNTDRVYFADSKPITAVEDCGKNCIKSVTTVTPTLHKKSG